MPRSNSKFCGEGRREGTVCFSEQFWGKKKIETHKNFTLPLCKLYYKVNEEVVRRDMNKINGR